MPKRFALIPATLLLIFAVAAPAADPGFPLVQSLASFPFDEDAAWLGQGRVAATFTLSCGNVFMFSEDGATVSDLETLEAVLALRVGIARSLNLEVYSRWSGVHGGWLDGLIEDFHTAFGLPDNRRSQFVRNQVDYRFRDLHDRRRSAGVTGPFTIALSANLFRGGQWQVGGRLALQIPPAGAPGLVSDQSALITGAWIHWRKGAYTLGMSGHMAFFKTPTWLEGVAITPRIFLAEAWAGLGWFRAGLIWRSSPYRLGDASDAGWQILLGFRLMRGIELRFQEDLAPFNSTPDVRLGIRVRLDKLVSRRHME